MTSLKISLACTRHGQKGLPAVEDAANDAIAAAMTEGEIMAPDSGGEGTTPEHESTAATAQLLAGSNADKVSKMQRQIA